MNLYLINDRVRAILNQCDEDGALNDAQVAELDALDIDRVQRINDMLLARQESITQAEAVNVEAKRLKGLAYWHEARADSIKKAVEADMLFHNEESLKLPAFQYCRFQLNPPSVDIAPTFDLNKLPIEWKRIKVEADKTALLKAAQAGVEPPEGITIKQSKGLRIK